MKKITFILLTLFTFNAGAFLLTSGTYEMVQGNRDDLCPQEVQVHRADSGDTYLEVAYVGWCSYMGPYDYYCQDGVCGAGAIEIEILGKDYYRWENKGYGFSGHFEKKADQED